jgi:23S rRNA pseudouridine2605 synthase
MESGYIRAMKHPRKSSPEKTSDPTGGKTPEGDRIAKVLSRAGVASRREAEKMIIAGRVRVNGKIIDGPALNVTAKDKIEVDGRPLDAPEPARLWMYHKPTGLVTTTKDEQGRPTIFDDLPEELPRVMSVGRLDLNSEGLLLLTNDGGLKRKLELPSTGWLRRYRVRVKGNPTDALLDPLREGVVIDRELFQPMQVTIDRQQGANAWLTVGLREGKNREIRRAMENVGLSVNRLIRISYGPFQLGQLAQGEVEEVRRRVLRDQLGVEIDPEDSDKAKRPRPQRRGRAPGGPGAQGDFGSDRKFGAKKFGGPKSDAKRGDPKKGEAKRGGKTTPSANAPWDNDGPTKPKGAGKRPTGDKSARPKFTRQRRQDDRPHDRPAGRPNRRKDD